MFINRVTVTINFLYEKIKASGNAKPKDPASCKDYLPLVELSDRAWDAMYAFLQKLK